MPQLNTQQTEAFLTDAARAADVIRQVVQSDGFIHMFSHIDADGIAAGSIIAKALWRLDARFRIRITQWVDDKIITEIASDKPELVIFTDFGSGYLDLLKEKIPNFKIVIMDHHQINGTPHNNVTQVNPHLQVIDGATDISGSGVAYYVARAIDQRNIDLASVAIVGAMGDMQDRYDNRRLGGLNAPIVEDALKAKQLQVEKDLMFFGRETRPIHKALSSTTNPFLPGISGQEDKALDLLSGLNIPLKTGEKWRALRDLTREERERLCTELANHLLNMKLHMEITNLIGHIYILEAEEPWTPLRDAREFAVVLNSTGRMDRPSLGIALCLGDRKAAMDEANQVLDDYRKNINKYLNWVWEKPDRLRELENIYFIDGEDFISDKIIGTISSILVSSLPNLEKPIIAYANVVGEGLAKISGRSTDQGVRKGINLGEVMNHAATPLGGKGGGHNIAAGGQVPIDKAAEFVKAANELVGKQLRGEKLAASNHQTQL